MDSDEIDEPNGDQPVFIDFQAIIDNLDTAEDLELDSAPLTELLLDLHQTLQDNGLAADDPTTYRHIIVSYIQVVSIINQGIPADYAIEIAGRVAVRALRDLTRS
jgi:hypothetical protein